MIEPNPGWPRMFEDWQAKSDLCGTKGSKTVVTRLHKVGYVAVPHPNGSTVSYRVCMDCAKSFELHAYKVITENFAQAQKPLCPR